MEPTVCGASGTSRFTSQPLGAPLAARWAPRCSSPHPLERKPYRGRHGLCIVDRLVQRLEHREHAAQCVSTADVCCTGTVLNARLSASDAELPDPRPPAPAHSQSGGARDSYSVHMGCTLSHHPCRCRKAAPISAWGWEKRKDFMEVSQADGNQPLLTTSWWFLFAPSALHPIPHCLSPLLLISHLGMSSSKNCSPAPPLDSILCRAVRHR